jgi:hypothetical protein
MNEGAGWGADIHQRDIEGLAWRSSVGGGGGEEEGQVGGGKYSMPWENRRNVIGSTVQDIQLHRRDVVTFPVLGHSQDHQSAFLHSMQA